MGHKQHSQWACVTQPLLSFFCVTFAGQPTTNLHSYWFLPRSSNYQDIPHIHQPTCSQKDFTRCNCQNQYPSSFPVLPQILLLRTPSPIKSSNCQHLYPHVDSILFIPKWSSTAPQPNRVSPPTFSRTPIKFSHLKPPQCLPPSLSVCPCNWERAVLQVKVFPPAFYKQPSSNRCAMTGFW